MRDARVIEDREVNTHNSEKIPMGFKKTKLGLIPEEWKEAKLREVTSYVDYRGKTPPKSDRGIFLVTAKNIKNGRVDYSQSKEYIPSGLYEEVMSRGVPKLGDVLITTEAPLGVVAPVDNVNVALAQRIIKYRTKSGDLFQPYLLWFLQSPRFQLELLRESTGSTVQGIKGSRLHKLPIVLPPLPEQQKIAAILGTWDEAIQKCEHTITALKSRNKGLAQQLLSGKKRLKGFEGEWVEYSFNDIADRITRRNEELDDTVVTISAQRGFVRQEDFFKKRVASTTLSNYYLIHRGEFAYNKSYSNGYPMGAFKRVESSKKAVVTTLYICFSLKAGVSSDFMVHFFEAGGMVKNLMRIAQEGGRAHGLLNIGVSNFFELKLTLPTLREQQAIAKVLNEADRDLQLYQEKLTTLKDQKKGLMQKLLTGEVRVKTENA